MGVEVKQSVGISVAVHKRLVKHCNKSGEKIYRAVERFITEGIEYDKDKEIK